MEGFEEFLRGFLKVIFIAFAFSLLIITAILYEQNKKIKRELYECGVELNIVKQIIK